MLVVFPTCSGDLPQLVELLKWIESLGGCKGHKALICADAAIGWHKALDAKREADKSFDSTVIISTARQVTGWPKGANHLFSRAANDIAKFRKEPWLWMEPDAVPLKPGWLDAIDEAYKKCGTPYMGHIYECSTAGLPTRLMSGIAVYHPQAFTDLNLNPDSLQAFDVGAAGKTVSSGSHTDLIHHVWGEKGKPPTFRSKAVHGTEVFSLDSIPPNAVIWHRNKDGSLIRLLKGENIGEPNYDREFVVVLPFFNGDARQMGRNIRWQAELTGFPQYHCLLAFEDNTVKVNSDAIISAAKSAYKKVDILTYPKAPRPKWPDGPNWAFQRVAKHMQQLGKSWLFMESDMVPLVPGWLTTLQDEYTKCNRAFMGSIVPHFGHLNGTSVYPPDLPTRCPKVMSCTNVAFDTVAKNEMLADHHDASHLMCHAWGLHEGKPHPFLGRPITFRTEKQVKDWIPDEAVTFHRSKDGSLIEMLRKQRLQPA